RTISDNRPWFGIVANARQIATSSNVTVNAVLPHSSAYHVLRPGDVITAVNGVRAALGRSIIDELLQTRVGERVRLQIERGATARTVIVSPASRVDSATAISMMPILDVAHERPAFI